MPSSLRRIVIQWPRLGPYHLARLRAVHEQCRSAGIELIALETASRDDVYEWREEQGNEPFRRVQAFPGRAFESVRPREMAQKISRLLDELQPDAVAIHTYSFPDSRACIDWCRRNRRGAIVMTDSKRDDAERSAFREGVKNRLLRGFDAAVTAGSASRDYLIALGFSPDHIWFGYDVVDNVFFARTTDAIRKAPGDWRTLPGLDDPRPYFLVSARFIARKNLLRMLDAYEAYRGESENPWRLVFLGDGPQRAELEARAASFPAGAVSFAGFRQIDEIPAYYAFAGAFILPSLVDQWALVVNEAMASGLPVIVSRGAGCHRDLVAPGGNGFVFSPEHSEQLTDAMVRLVQKGDELPVMGDRSRRIIAEWSPDRFAASILAAARVASAGADRAYPLVTRCVIAGLRLLGRSTTSFHAIES